MNETKSYRLRRTLPEPARPAPIDYERMRKVWPKQVAALDAAVAEKDAAKVGRLCREAVEEWNEIGAWPDDWAKFQRALDDVLPWPMQADLVDVATGIVVIEEVEG